MTVGGSEGERGEEEEEGEAERTERAALCCCLRDGSGGAGLVPGRRLGLRRNGSSCVVTAALTRGF